MSESKYERVAKQSRPDSVLSRYDKKRLALIEEVAALKERRQLLEKDSYEYKEIGVNINSVNAELAKIKSISREVYQTLATHFRKVCEEYFPTHIVSEILDEANNRMYGAEPRQRNFKAWSEEEMDVLTNLYPAIKNQLAEKSRKINELKSFISKNTPDLQGQLTPEQYNERIAWIKFCSKLQSIIKN